MKRNLLAAMLVCVCCSGVLAHSALQRSEPKDGARLAQSPNEIRIWFSEPIKVALSSFAVRDRAGKQIDKGDLRADVKEPMLVHLSLPPKLGPGVYKVSWSAVAQDLHVGKGGFSFEIARQ